MLLILEHLLRKGKFLVFKKDEENIYQLVISFPLEYNSYDYQGIVEGIKIIIESKQVTSE